MIKIWQCPYIHKLHRSQIYNPAEGIIAAKHMKQQAIIITYHIDA